MGPVPARTRTYVPGRVSPACVRVGPVLLFLAVATAAAAQVAEGPPAVRFDRPAVTLPHPEVQVLAQDADGLIWVGTRDGLARHDGLGLTVFQHRPGAGRSLPSSDVESLLITADGTLWAGTDRGVARLDVRTDAFRRVTPAEGPCGGPATWLVEGGAGRLLYGSRQAGLCRFDVASGRRTPVVLPWTPGRVWEVQAAGEGAAWVLGPRPEDACRIEPDEARPTCRLLDLGGFGPRVLGLDAEGRLLAYGRPPDGAWELRRWSRGQFVPLVGGLPEVGWAESADLVVVGREAWLGTATGGILAIGLETGDWRWLGPSPGDPTALPAHRVRSLLVDRQGGVWAGTSRGLAVWRAPVWPFTFYRRYSGAPGEISDDRVNGMTEGRDGGLWVTTNGGLNRLDPETDRFEPFLVPEAQDPGPPAWAPTPDDPYRDAWWQVLEGVDGTLWVGGKRNGLFRLDRRTGRFRREVEASRALGLVGADGTPRGFGVRHLFEDAQGRLWVGTTGEGLAVRSPEGRWEAVWPSAAPGGLPHPNVNRFYQDAVGALWVGTDAGLARITDPEAGRETRFEPVAGVEGPVWSVAESPTTPGVLWVGTVGHGLLHVEGEQVTGRLGVADGLPSDLVYGVVPDGDGNLWASTSRGLARLDPATGRLDVFDGADGLADDAFDLMAFYRSPTTGRLWFGGLNGLVRVDPAGFGLATYRPPVAFTAVQIGDDRQPGRPLDGDTLRFRHDQNFLTVQFAALDYTAPRQLRYRYQLSGVDPEWRETTGERPFATYTALSPGTYTLSVLAANAEGVWNDEPSRLTLVVEPAWWQGLPAQAVALLLLVGLGATGVVVAMGVGSRAQRREQWAAADELHRGPVRGLGDVSRSLGEEDGQPVAEGVRARIGEVETGLHDVLLRLKPSASGDLELGRALDATVRRVRRSAPEVEIRTDWSGVARLDEAVQCDVVAVVGHVLDHALLGHPESLWVVVADEGTEVAVRVRSDRAVPARPTPLQRRVGGGASGLARALRVVRALGGRLDVEPAEAGDVVVVRLPRGGASTGASPSG